MDAVAVADDQAAGERRPDVVRVPLELSRQGRHVGVELKQVVGGEQSGDDRRGAGAKAAAEGNPRGDAEREPVGGVQALERPDEEVAAIPRHIEVRDHLERARLDNLKLEVQGECRCEHVEARAEVRARCRHADDPPAGQGHCSTARSIAPISGSHGTTAPAWPRAVCGSLSPWPVSTHTIRRAPSAP